MSSSQTEYNKLHIWRENDAFLREEFNENFQKIDEICKNCAVLIDSVKGQIPRIAAGSYSGNGGVQQINVGFKPRAVFLCANAYTALITGAGGHATLTENGFQVVHSAQSDHQFNKSGWTYSYAALG